MPPKNNEKDLEKTEKYNEFLNAWTDAFKDTDLSIDPEIFSDTQRIYIYDDSTPVVDFKRFLFDRNRWESYDPKTNPMPHKDLLQEYFNYDYLTGKGKELYVFKPGNGTPYKVLIGKKDGKISFELEKHEIPDPHDIAHDLKAGLVKQLYDAHRAEANKNKEYSETELHDAEKILKAGLKTEQHWKERLQKKSPEDALADIKECAKLIWLPKMRGEVFSEENARNLAPAAECLKYLNEHPQLQGLSEEDLANLKITAAVYGEAMDLTAKRRNLSDSELISIHRGEEYVEAQLDLIIMKFLCGDSIRSQGFLHSFKKDAKDLILGGRQNALKEALKKDPAFWKLLENENPFTAGKTDKAVAKYAKALKRAKNIFANLPKEPAKEQPAPQQPQPQPQGKTLQSQTLTKIQRKGDAYMAIARQSVEGDSPALSRLQEKLTVLNQTLSALSTKEEEQDYPVLHAEQAETLKEEYRQALQACEEAAKSSRKNAGLSRAAAKIYDMLKKDLKRIEKFREGIDISLPFLLQSSVTEAIDLDAMHHGPVLMHGQMSQRMAMTLEITDGDHKTAVSGLFTQQSFHKSTSQAVDEYFEQHPELETQERVLKAGAAAQGMALEKLTDHLELSNADDRHEIRIKPESYLRNDQQFLLWYRNNLLAGDVNDGLLANEAMYKVLLDLKEVISKSYTEDVYGIKAGRRLDQRNSAMTETASLLGMPDIIAKAVPVIVRRNGQLISGTFMEFAKGEDARNLTAGNHFAGITKEDLNENTNLLRQAADLQVLDFICGNTDRHGGNMFYQFDKNGKITGIQGIDNDMSFCLLSKDILRGSKAVGNFTGLSAMHFINKKTADRIKSITPEMLKLQLAHYELSLEELKAAEERLVMLQKALDDRFVRENPEEFAPEKLSQPQNDRNPKVFIISEEQLKQVKMSHVMPPKREPNAGKLGQNTFEHLSRELLAANRDMQQYESDKDMAMQQEFANAKHVAEKMKENKKKEDLPQASVSIRKRSFDPAVYAEKMHIKVEELKVSKGFSPSQEYKNVLEYARLVRNKFESMEGPSEENFKTACTMLENLDDLCTVYLDKKKKEGTLKKDRAVQHVFAVQNLQDMVKNACTKLGEADKDCYRRLSQTQRNGAFRFSRDSAKAAECIHALKNAAPAEFDEKNRQLTMLFDGIARNRCAEALEGYAQQIGCLSDAKGVSDEMKKDLINLAINIQSMIKIDQKKQSASMEDVEHAKALIVQFRKKTELKEERFRHIDCGLDHVQWRIESGFLSKPSVKGLLAERLIIRASQNSNHPEYRDFIKDRQSFIDAKNRLLSSREFKQMTAHKTIAQLKAMVTEPEDTLVEKYNAPIYGTQRRPAAHR